jgi:hypothetical protein
MIFGEEDLGNAVRGPFGNGSDKAVIPGIESCTCVHHASDHGGIRVVEGLTKEKRDAGHKALEPDLNDWARWADTSGEDADVVHVGDMSASATALAKARCVRRSAGASNTCNHQSDTGRIASRNADCLVDLLGDAFLAFVVKIREVGGCKILVLLVVVGLLLALVIDAVYASLRILPNLGVSSIGAFDNIGFIYEEQPRVGPATPKAAEGATTAASISGGRTIVPASAILSKSSLSLACIHFGLKCLARGPAHCLNCDGPDIIILRFCFDSSLHHLL